MASATIPPLKRPRRVRHDSPTADPKLSPHWQSLNHLPDDKILENFEQVRETFRADVVGSDNDNAVVPLWSAICGYCEALATHKDDLKRYSLFPLPIDALRRLVQDEFVPWCQQLRQELSVAATHREKVRHVANAVWKKAHGKSKNARDELHANSLYVCFRGSIDKRSLDCFGAAIVTICALQHVLEGSNNSSSYLTLSEDHAYESHRISNGTEDEILGTCEIAIPGNTKDVQQTRGLEITQALQKANKNKTLSYTVTPENSWLYMKDHAVVCRTTAMVLGAVIGNINCSIQAGNGRTQQHKYFVSGPLMDLKRELLWILKENNSLDVFPYALMELGECEEHRTTAKGLTWVDAVGFEGEILALEKLYLDAMSTSKSLYGDAQAYPYFCAGHYHKDSVWEEVDNGTSEAQFNPQREYRLVEAVRLYSEACRVASRYCYDMQLMKHTTKAAKLILEDILTLESKPRAWSCQENAIALGTWLVAFYDCLLMWEEGCGGKQFCEVLTCNHPYSIGKLFQCLSVEIRRRLMGRIYATGLIGVAKEDSTAEAITENNLLYFAKPRSKRFQQGSPLAVALVKEKVVVKEMELTITMSDTGGRRAKRRRS